MSPYPNEHSARLLDPDLFETCRRTSRESKGKIYHILTCKYKKTPEGKSDWAEQSYRYPIENWTEEEARAHCESKGGTFEPAEEEIKITQSKGNKYLFAFPISLEEDQHQVDIEILREGSWAVKKAPGGVLKIDKAKLEEFVKNFQNQVVGEELPLDVDHRGKTIGWLRKLWINTKDGLAHLFGRLDITDPATQEKVKEGSLKYFSPSLEINWQDPETQKYFDVIRSGALTNWPYIKNMQPAIVNFSEIREVETTPDRKTADQLQLVESQRDQARQGAQVLLKEIRRLVGQVKLQDKTINNLKLEFDLRELLDTGRATPFECQEVRGCKDPKQIQLFMKLAKTRTEIPLTRQQSILAPRRQSGGIGRIVELLEKESDPERQQKLLKLATEAIEEQKEKRGIK